MKTFKFPTIKRVLLTDFSIYSKERVIEVEIDKNVFCLAGANGLGKSTFISILNYALTGIVRNPERSFSKSSSIPRFYSNNKSFASNYFDGRINERSRELAEVEIEFEVGDFHYVIKRGFFEFEELREFSRTNLRTGELTEIPEEYTAADLCVLYMKLVTEDIGLTEFSQFAFIQHYVLTFDESHELLFWDNEMMERVLYLFFGVDSEDAKLADELRRKIKKYTSDSGNLQWDITQASKELEHLVTLASSSESTEVDQEVANEYQRLTEQLIDLLDQLEQNRQELKQVKLDLADYSLKISSHRRDYEELFNSTRLSPKDVSKDPKILEIVKSLHYVLVEKGNHNVITESLVKYIKKNYVEPAGEPQVEAEGVFASMKVLDEEINELKGTLSDKQQKESRLKDEQVSIEDELRRTKEKVSAIENENEDFINKLYAGKATDVTELVAKFRQQITSLEQKKLDAVESKNKFKGQLQELEKKLKKQYHDAEEVFIPLFTKYAQSFIGLELNVRIRSYAKGITLDLEVNDTHRKNIYELSESQRYFLDIALRMALIEHATENSSLTIDTPEGSLDIAYENKAGLMFAKFSQKPYQLILTANINTSQLLLAIADKCKSQGMKLERMTDWSTLSEVQVELEGKIKEAYAEIEKALN